jgi:hypothetical protein
MSTAWERPSKRCSLASRRSAGMIRMARKAEDDTTTEVAEAPGLELADFHNTRKSLLASAVPFQEELVRQKSDDPKVEAAPPSRSRKCWPPSSPSSPNTAGN